MTAERIGKFLGLAISVALLVYAILTSDGTEAHTARIVAPVLLPLLFLAWLFNRKLDAILAAVRRRP